MHRLCGISAALMVAQPSHMGQGPAWHPCPTTPLDCLLNCILRPAQTMSYMICTLYWSCSCCQYIMCDFKNYEDMEADQVNSLVGFCCGDTFHYGIQNATWTGFSGSSKLNHVSSYGILPFAQLFALWGLCATFLAKSVFTSIACSLKKKTGKIK